MTPHARRMLLWGHLALGIATAPVLVALGTTGALLELEPEVTAWASPHVTALPAGAPAPSVQELIDRVRQATRGAGVVSVQLPADVGRAAIFQLAGTTVAHSLVYVDPASGSILGGETRADAFFQSVRAMHRTLSSGERGGAVVAWSTVGLLLLAMSGVVLWWPARITRVRGRASGWRWTLQLHQLVGIYALIFLIIFAITGLVIHWEAGARGALARVSGSGIAALPQRDAPDCVSRASLDADALLRAATAAMRGARATAIQLPSGNASPVRVSFRYPEDGTPNGRSLVFVASCSGAVLFRVSTRTAPASYTVPRMWNRSVHTGDVFGVTTRWLAALASLLLPLLAISGVTVTVTRRLRRPRPLSKPLLPADA